MFQLQNPLESSCVAGRQADRQLQELQDKAEGKQGGFGSSAPRTSCLAGSRKEDAILPGNTAFPRTPPPRSSTKQTKHPCFLLARNEDLANMATGEDLVEGKKKQRSARVAGNSRCLASQSRSRSRGLSYLNKKWETEGSTNCV